MIARSWPVVAALLLAACTAPASSPTPPPSPLARLSCPDSIGEEGPPMADLEVLLDAAALPTQRVLQANDHLDGWLFAKMGLFVRPHLTVELSVEPGTDADVEYGPGDRMRRVVLAQCTQLPGRWIVYTGGYYVRKPMCLPVRLRANGSEVVARIPVGVACEKS